VTGATLFITYKKESNVGSGGSNNNIVFISPTPGATATPTIFPFLSPTPSVGP